MKTLSGSQINRLYQFTRQHYVEYYDVQTELVDHLANGIESQWQDNPGVSFEEALQLEFKKFGIYGFSDIVEKRQQAMEKKYFRVILNETFVLLKKPYVFLTIISLLFACVFILNMERWLNYITYSIFAYFVVVLIAFFKRSASLKKKKNRRENLSSRGGNL